MILAEHMLVAEPSTRRWTRDEYHRMADAGLFDGQRVELVGGEVFVMAPQRDEHAQAVTLVDYALREVFGKGYTVRVQLPMDLGDVSEPEPDVAVVRGTPRAVKRHPKDALLIVEVAIKSLDYDREYKGGLYAAHGVRDYWIVNLIDNVVEVYRRPERDEIARFGHGYGDVAVRKAGEVVSPLAARRSKVKVSDLLP